MNTQKYDATKFRKIIETTIMNYANMIKRLERKKSVSEFVMTYYSVFLIITTLTGKYFPEYYNTVVSDYFNIILSIVVLIYSLIIKNADYSTRISSIMDSLNQLKAMKREVGDETLESCNKKYNEIADRTERRDDVDFFKTVKHLCKAYEINWLTKKHKKSRNKDKHDIENTEEYARQEKVVRGYISEINVFVAEGKIVFEVIWNVILFLIPVVLFVVCIITKDVL